MPVDSAGVHVSGIRTAHWDDWTLDDLVGAKGDTRVSLVVPARNEAGTVGDVVGRVRDRLVDTVSLVNEIVVIDSDSTDGTYDAATSAGAVVHRSSEIRPDLGTHPGKGEAMWKSLFVTSGDVLVFMDADLTDWDTHFVPGLLGPLLTSPDVQLVKGFYERPGAQGPLDGGRVTELVARPLISLLYPQLQDLAQPLAGEWAVRRAHFASLSVPTGYAVELAALVDTVTARGPSAIAQVDLGTRSHGHQPLLDLGAMAVQILSATLSRAESAHLGVADAPSRLISTRADTAILRQFLPGPVPMDRVVETVERPPAEALL
jgi:glucosyl-3-phosphoglycerate synthase